MNWNKVNRCKHEWSDHLEYGSCEGVEHCTWEESHCLKCGVFHVVCGCGWSDARSGWSQRRTRRNKWRKKYFKLIKQLSKAL